MPLFPGASLPSVTDFYPPTGTKHSRNEHWGLWCSPPVRLRPHLAQLVFLPWEQTFVLRKILYFSVLSIVFIPQTLVLFIHLCNHSFTYQFNKDLSVAWTRFRMLAGSQLQTEKKRPMSSWGLYKLRYLVNFMLFGFSFNILTNFFLFNNEKI